MLAFTFASGQATIITTPETLPQQKNTGADTTRLLLLLRKGNYYLDKDGYEKTDLDSVSIIMIEAEKLGRSLSERKWEREVRMLAGHYYFETGDTIAGNRCFKELIQFYNKNDDTKTAAATWLKMGEAIPYRGHSYAEDKIKCFRQSALMYHQMGNQLQELQAYNLIAEAHGTDGQLKPALAEFESLLKQYQMLHYKKLQDIYGWLAYLNKSNGQLSTALAYDIEAVKYMEANADSIGAPMHYAHLGCTYAELGMKDKALPYMKKAIAISKSRPGAPYIHYYLNIAVACINKVESPKNGLAYLQNIIAQIPPVSISQKQFVYQAYAYCYQKLGNYIEAEKNFLKYVQCMDILYAQKDEDDYGYFMANKDICSFYVSTGQYTKAAFYIKKIEQMPDGLKNSLSLSEFQHLQFKVDSANENYAAAIQHLLLYKQMQDSMFSAVKSKQIEELNVQYETEKKNKNLLLQSKNIQLLTNQTKLQQVQVLQSTLLKNSMICGAGLLLVLLAVGYSRYRIKQKKNQQLEISQTEISAKNTKLEKLLQENDWLLREVHHRVKNNLQIVMSLLHSQSAFLKDEAALNAMLESQQRVQAMSLIHQKLYKSNNASSIYMPEYIRDLVDYLKDSFRLTNNIYFDLLIDPIGLDVLQAVPVGLILNEVITNSIKYAFSNAADNRITIQLSRIKDTGKISLMIKDNGKGLPENFDINENNSFGIILINGLAEDLEGNCMISSGGGTTVTLTFPDVTTVIKNNIPSS